jgi:hypothetical protein
MTAFGFPEPFLASIAQIGAQPISPLDPQR